MAKSGWPVLCINNPHKNKPTTQFDSIFGSKEERRKKEKKEVYVSYGGL